MRHLLELSPIRDRDLSTLYTNESAILKFAHRARYRLAARADHLRDRLVGEWLRDCGGATFIGCVEQEPRNASVDIEKHQTPDLLVGASQTPRQFDQHGPRD